MPQLELLYNTAYGGFGFSKPFIDAFKTQFKVKGKEPKEPKSLARTDTNLIGFVKQFGLEKSSGEYCSLAIAEINYPEQISRKYIGFGVRISEYDGQETAYFDKQAVIFKMLEDRQFKDLDQIYHLMALLEQVEVIDECRREMRRIQERREQEERTRQEREKREQRLKDEQAKREQQLAEMMANSKFEQGSRFSFAEIARRGLHNSN